MMASCTIVFLVFGAILNYINCDCPGDDGFFEEISGTCYYLSFNHEVPKKSWPDARQFCKTLDIRVPKGWKVDLAEVGSSESCTSDSLLMQRIAQIGEWGTWLGASDADVEGQWKWVTSGRSLSLLDPFWENTQPNKIDSPHTGDCLLGFIAGHYHRAYFGDWNCQKVHAFACQIMRETGAVVFVHPPEMFTGAVVFVHPPEMSCKSAGGAWIRPSGDVSNSVQGVADCAAKCAGYTYFGLECPRGTVHCQCANTLVGSTSADDCDRQRDHCIGPFTQEGYMMGGADRGSVYLVKPSAGVTDVPGRSDGEKLVTFSDVHFYPIIESTRGCPGPNGQFVENNGNCFYFSSDSPLGKEVGWQEARDSCKQLGKDLRRTIDLAELESSSDEWLMGQLQLKDNKMWIGGYDPSHGDRGWIWVHSGRAISLANTFWAPNEPNHVGGDEWCLNSQGYGDQNPRRHYINDEPCTCSMGYVCQVFQDK